MHGAPEFSGNRIWLHTYLNGSYWKSFVLSLTAFTSCDSLHLRINPEKHKDLRDSSKCLRSMFTYNSIKNLPRNRGATSSNWSWVHNCRKHMVRHPWAIITQMTICTPERCHIGFLRRNRLRYESNHPLRFPCSRHEINNYGLHTAKNSDWTIDIWCKEKSAV